VEGTGKFLLRQELLEVNSDNNPVFKRGAKDNNRKVKSSRVNPYRAAKVSSIERHLGCTA